KAAAEAAACTALVYLGVREGDAAVSTPVGGETDQAPAEPKLIAARFRHVDDLGFCNGSRPSLELVGSAEVLDQLPGRVRDACVAVIGEAAPVSRREPPGVTLVQVREDLACAAIEP